MTRARPVRDPEHPEVSTLTYPHEPNQPPDQPPPYGQQPYPPQPGYAPPPVPPAKKGMGTGKLLLLIGGVLFVVCCGGGVIYAAVNGGKSPSATSTRGSTGTAVATTTTGTANGATKPAGKAHAKLGEPARDGKFEFVVTKVQCGVAKVGDQYLNKTAQGQYCLITVTVKNIGTKAQTFDGSSQHAYGAGGLKYDHDGTAEIYANSGAQTFLEQINPGNSVTGVLVFDIPKDKTIVGLELHDSPFSGGVVVDLT